MNHVSSRVQHGGPARLARRGVAVVALAALTACSSGGSAKPTATTSAGTAAATVDAEGDMQSAWQSVVADIGPTAVSTEPTQVDIDMLAASSDGNSTRVQLWRYDGSRWVEDAVLGLSDGFATVTGIQFMDVTNDSHLELFVNFAGILANGAEVFVKEPTGWRATGAFANLVYNNGALSGSQPFCTNSQCATPITVPFTRRGRASAERTPRARAARRQGSGLGSASRSYLPSFASDADQ